MLNHGRWRIGLALGLAWAVAEAGAAGVPFAWDGARSSLGVEVKATGHSFTVAAARWAGNLQWDPAAGAFLGGTLTVAWGDLGSEKEKRDREMRHWSESESFPEITCRIREVRPAPGGGVALADFTLHGTTRPVEIPFQTKVVDGTLQVEGEWPLDHREFGLARIRKMGLLTVDPVVRVAFRLVGPVPGAP